MDLNLKVKIYLEDSNDKFMGIGVLWLLQEIEKQGSIRAAASTLGISYSKAYLMVENLEKALNCKIVDRKKGGQDRSGAVLTPFAKQFMSLYDNFQTNCKSLLNQPFEQFTQNLEKLLEDKSQASKNQAK